MIQASEYACLHGDAMLARFFIERPIFAWVISIVIILLGGVAYFTLPIAQYPDITPPTVQVTATYPGANAKVVADSVAAPIEQQVNGVERMLYMSSQCTNDGAYNLTVTFDLGTDLNIAQVLVQNRVALAMPQLPQQVQVQGVSTKKKSPSILLVVNLVSPDGRYDDIYLSNYATIQVKDKLLRIPGVGDVTFLGQRDYSMRIWLDPDKMTARGLQASDITYAVQNQNVQVAAGQIGQQPVPEGQQFQYTMSTLGRLESVDDFANIIVKTGVSATGEQKSPSSQVVRLKDVARIELGAQQYDQIARLDGRPTVGLAIFQLPGSNALKVAEQIKHEMATMKKAFPDGIDYEIVYDTTPFIEQSIEEVIKSLRDAIILVAIVVLFFLQDWKAMILPMIDVPVSLIGTFAVMAVMGFTLNNLTLFGLVLAVGIVVDDAIVVLENIERLIATGLDPKSATIKAMDEVTGPIIGITLVLISVFLPAAFIPGITGQFFRQFALTIASAMVISAINAMTLTPARAVTIFQTEGGEGGHHEHVREALPWWIFGLLCLVSLKYLYSPIAAALGLPAGEETILDETQKSLSWVAWTAALLPGLIGGLILGKVIIKPVNRFLSGFFKRFNQVFDGITAAYGAIVARFLRVLTIVLVVYLGFIAATYWTMTHAPTGFIPLQDQGYLLVNVQLPDSASVQRTAAIMDKFNRMMLGDDTGKYKGPPPAPGEKRYPGIPGVAHAQSIAGQSFLLSANGSNFGSCFVILEPFKDRRSHEKYDEVIASKIRKLVATEIEDAIVVAFRAPPIQGLGTAGGFKFYVIQPGFVDFDELQSSVDEMTGEGNKNPKLVGLFSTFRAETPQLYVDIDRTKCESLGVKVQDVFATLQVYMGGQFVNLFNQFGRTWQVNLMAEPAFRTSADSVRQLKVRNIKGEMVPIGTVADIQDKPGPVMVTRYKLFNAAAVSGNTAPGVSSGQGIQEIDKLANSLGVNYEWTEITFMQILAGNVAIYVFFLGSLLVYLVLAAKYESWHLPLSVILVVPMCLLSSVVGMLIARLPVDIFVQIGFLVLVGLAAKNAILIVEFAEQLRLEGRTPAEAILESCKLRFRPIVMTSFAFILGVVPLIVGHGAGAEMRKSLGTAVFAGMCGVTIFGVFLTPVFYLAISKLTGAKAKPAAAHAPAPAADTGIKADGPGH
jgi:multidrug efflux pump